MGWYTFHVSYKPRRISPGRLTQLVECCIHIADVGGSSPSSPTQMLARSPLSAIVLTKDNESTIRRTLESLAFCEEVVVMDGGSVDKTKDIAHSFGNVHWIDHHEKSDFSKMRNGAQQLCSHEWMLHVDSDEIVPQGLQDEVRAFIGNFGAYRSARIPRQDIFWGTPLTHGEVGAAMKRGIVRLIRKGSGQWSGRVHEVFNSNGSVAIFANHLDHFSHASVVDFLHKINHYSTLRAQELALHKPNRFFVFFQMLVWPPSKFIYTYLLKMGFRDGAAGFVYSFMMSFHSFLVRAKLLANYL